MVDNQKTIDVRVKRELGSEGEPTGKYVFTVDTCTVFIMPNSTPLVWSGTWSRRVIPPAR